MKKKIIITCLVLVLIIDLILVLTNNITFIDNEIHNILYRDNFVDIMKYITFFGGSIAVSLITGISCIILVFKKQKKEAISIVIIVVLTTIINNIVKLIISRDRPEYILVNESFYSFPSGHAMGATALYGYLIYIFYNSNLKKQNKIIISVLLSILIISVCISRIILGAHYFSDIIAGIILSILLIIIYNYILKKVLKK